MWSARRASSFWISFGRSRGSLAITAKVCQTEPSAPMRSDSVLRMTDDAIVVEGLKKSYGSVRALCGVDFAARTGRAGGPVRGGGREPHRVREPGDGRAPVPHAQGRRARTRERAARDVR